MSLIIRMRVLTVCADIFKEVGSLRWEGKINNKTNLGRRCKLNNNSVEGTGKDIQVETALIYSSCVTRGCTKLDTPTSQCLNASDNVVLINIQDSEMGI